MHALVNSYGVWKKSLPLLWLCKITAKIFPPHCFPVWDLVLVFTERSLQGSLLTLFPRASTSPRTKKDEKPTGHHLPCLAVGVKPGPYYTLLLTKVFAHSADAVAASWALAAPTQPMCSGRLHKASLRRSLPSSSEMNDSTDLLVGHLYSYGGESKYLAPEICRLHRAGPSSIQDACSIIAWPRMNNAILTHPIIFSSFQPLCCIYQNKTNRLLKGFVGMFSTSEAKQYKLNLWDRGH